jgi:Domain of unknown function (DUF5615)
MRFLANETFPGAAVTALEAAGHDVVWVRIAAPGTTDPDVLAWAAREERILLTLDKDFRQWLLGGPTLSRRPVAPCQAAGRKLRQRAASWFDLIEAGLRGREGCDRLHYRRRPGRRVRARDHGRAQALG